MSKNLKLFVALMAVFVLVAVAAMILTASYYGNIAMPWSDSLDFVGYCVGSGGGSCHAGG